MEIQNYANHRRFHPIYHYVAMPLSFLLLIGSLVNVFRALSAGEQVYQALLLLLMTGVVLIAVMLVRVYPLKLQDRTIRAEENLRHYVLTGKLIDTRLTVSQIAALRFADDKQFPDLARQAADKDMAPDQIKKAVAAWKPDTYRV